MEVLTRPADDIPVGTQIDGRYTVEAVLGKGGMATVYRVSHNRLGSSYALKVLRLGGPTIRDRLLQEGRIQAAIRHPNVVSVFDVIDVAGSPALVAEFVDGLALDELLARRRLTTDQVDALVEGIVAGVLEAHRHGVVHRDLKPANVMLARTATGLLPKVTDFGLSKVLTAGMPGFGRTQPGIMLGTPAYMAPEQIDDSGGVDQRADVFALGVILYELVCGLRPFRGSDDTRVVDEVLAGRYIPPRTLVPGLPARMCAALEGALHVDRTTRIPNCETLLATWRGPGTGDDRHPRGPWSDSIVGGRRVVIPSPGEPTSTVTPSPTWEDNASEGGPTPEAHGHDDLAPPRMADMATGEAPIPVVVEWVPSHSGDDEVE